MAIDSAQVTAIAQLARLKIDDQDIPEYAHQLSRILDFVAQMERVNTDGIEPLAHPYEFEARLRPDSVNEIDQRSLFQINAPATADGYYLVPKVID